TGSPADPDERKHRSAAGLGDASGQPRRTHARLSARAPCRHARLRPRPRHRALGGDEVTALTVATRLDEDASPRPVPWRAMAWVTWRQHRIALVGMAAFLGAVAVYVWQAGLQLHHAYAAA